MKEIKPTQILCNCFDCTKNDNGYCVQDVIYITEAGMCGRAENELQQNKEQGVTKC